MCDIRRFSDQFMCEFLELYKNETSVWKIKSPEYSDRNLKNEAYERLLLKLREHYPEAQKINVVKTIKSFRGSFRKALKRMRDSQNFGSGTDEAYKTKLWYFPLLSFLTDQELSIGLPTTSNIQGLSDDGSEESSTVASSNILENLLVKAKETTTVEKGAGPSYERKSAPPSQSPKRKFVKNYEVEDRSNEHSSLASTSSILRESSDEADILGETWALEFKKLSPEQQIFAKKAINDILFEAQLGNLARHSIVINRKPEKPSFDTERFITEVQSRPVLWNMNVEEYSNCDLKKSAWEELVDIFVIEEETTAVDRNAFGRFLRRKWNKLRDSFYRESQRFATLKSGLATSMKSPCSFYNQLSFLHKGIKTKDKDKDTISIMDVEPVAEMIPSEGGGATTILPESSWAHRHKRKKSEMESPEMAQPQPVDIIRNCIQSLDERERPNEEDGERLFLLSLINPLKNIPLDLRFSVRIQMMQLIENASRRDCDPEIDKTLPFQDKISV